ncbi:unnamed protein product [Vitrella brassicaformis CCMP3155]|uniref:Uncharacterized protein n=1 Tax=Vitrella brassicaformis (strain CCMP3155) TaxID=1169540 RepID=A0A0G4GYD6_VITBC|nr:unnamed protein product [Vitrella brassicaformis CCMP3155]|eukprot:CEM36146.1 unnamed protein product [Vitrella brassicaformis CCMP3155]
MGQGASGSRPVLVKTDQPVLVSNSQDGSKAFVMLSDGKKTAKFLCSRPRLKRRLWRSMASLQSAYGVMEGEHSCQPLQVSQPLLVTTGEHAFVVVSDGEKTVKVGEQDAEGSQASITVHRAIQYMVDMPWGKAYEEDTYPLDRMGDGTVSAYGVMEAAAPLSEANIEKRKEEQYVKALEDAMLEGLVRGYRRGINAESRATGDQMYAWSKDRDFRPSYRAGYPGHGGTCGADRCHGQARGREAALQDAATTRRAVSSTTPLGLGLPKT